MCCLAILVAIAILVVTFYKPASSRIASEEEPRNSLQISFFTRDPENNMPTPIQRVVAPLPTSTPRPSTSRSPRGPLTTPTVAPASPDVNYCPNYGSGGCTFCAPGAHIVGFCASDSSPCTGLTGGCFDGSSCIESCWDKPVIYLYPEAPMYVDVSLRTAGKIVASDPLYPAGGWKQVFAHPNGKLVYKEKTYRELFYETEVTPFTKPPKGISIKSTDLKKDLSKILLRLGLNSFEKQEFLDYWVPKLEKTGAPYIKFSIVEAQEKERIDHVEISPKPDTMIQFLAYFVLLQKPYNGPLLELPATSQKRIGFTAVEWGGSIEPQN